MWTSLLLGDIATSKTKNEVNRDGHVIAGDSRVLSPFHAWQVIGPSVSSKTSLADI